MVTAIVLNLEKKNHRFKPYNNIDIIFLHYCHRKYVYYNNITESQ